MKIKLFHPPGYQRFHPLPPLGIATLTSILRQEGHFVDQQDLELACWAHNWHRENDTEEIDLKLLNDYDRVSEYLLRNHEDVELEKVVNILVQKITYKNFDLTGFSIMGFRQLPPALCLASRIKEETDTITLFGGDFTSSSCMRILEKFKFVDYALIGESWHTVCQLVEVLEKSQIPDERIIPGLCCRKNDEVVLSDTRPPQINTMPEPDYEGLPLEEYKNQLNALYKQEFDFLILQYVISHGCVKDCVFCGRPALRKWQLKLSQRIALKPLDKIVRELERLSRRHKTNCFCFVCTEINSSDSWTRRFADAIIDEKLDILWHAYAIPADLSSGTLEKLYDSGCRLLRFGLETGSSRLLKEMRKGFTADEAERVLRSSSNAGIWNHLNLIVGYPHERNSDIEKTVEFIQRNAEEIDSVRINPYILHRDSWIYSNPEKLGIKVVAKDRDLAFFDEIGGLKWRDKKKQTLDFIERLIQSFQKNDLGFGTSYDLIFCSSIYFPCKDEAKGWLRKTHPYLFRSYPFQVIRWKIYHPGEEMPFPSTWDYFVGRALGYFVEV